MRTIPAEEFEAGCLELLEEVTPIEEEASLRGTVEYPAGTEQLMAPIDEPWDAATE